MKSSAVCMCIILGSYYLHSEAARLVKAPPKTISAVVGEPITLACGITDVESSKTRSVVRVVNNKNKIIAREDHAHPKEKYDVTLTPYYTVTIKNVTLSDSGKYLCGVGSFKGRSYHHTNLATFNLNVEERLILYQTTNKLPTTVTVVSTNKISISTVLLTPAYSTKSQMSTTASPITSEKPRRVMTTNVKSTTLLKTIKEQKTFKPKEDVEILENETFNEEKLIGITKPETEILYMTTMKKEILPTTDKPTTLIDKHGSTGISYFKTSTSATVSEKPVFLKKGIKSTINTNYSATTEKSDRLIMTTDYAKDQSNNMDTTALPQTMKQQQTSHPKEDIRMLVTSTIGIPKRLTVKLSESSDRLTTGYVQDQANTMETPLSQAIKQLQTSQPKDDVGIFIPKIGIPKRLTEKPSMKTMKQEKLPTTNTNSEIEELSMTTIKKETLPTTNQLTTLIDKNESIGISYFKTSTSAPVLLTTSGKTNSEIEELSKTTIKTEILPTTDTFTTLIEKNGSISISYVNVMFITAMVFLSVSIQV